MPYHLTAEPTFLRVVFVGELTGRDLQVLAHDVEAAERAHAVAPNRLFDLSQVSRMAIGFREAWDLVERRQALPLANRIKTALVAPWPVTVGFARMFQTLNDHPQVEVVIFPTIEAAEGWLINA